jgi:hypothetical protein
MSLAKTHTNWKWKDGKITSQVKGNQNQIAIAILILAKADLKTKLVRKQRSLSTNKWNIPSRNYKDCKCICIECSCAQIH